MILSGFLPVTHGHTIYYEVHGSGRPAMIVHGGPGGGIMKGVEKIYDLKKWQVLLFDQRGCGRSTPFGCLEHNTTWDLVADMDALREYMGWNNMFLSGGSWGTTLATAYAIIHSERVTGLLLRGMCFADDRSQKWLYQRGGASEVFPDAWKTFISVLPPVLHDKGWRKIMGFYRKKLMGPHSQRYANAWWRWESAISFLCPKPDMATAKETLALALLENHYFIHDCWLKKNQLLDGLHLLRHIPITVIHGRYDMVCPVQAAFLVKKYAPHTVLHITPDAGHGASEPGTWATLCRETRRMYHLCGKRTLRKHISHKKRKTLKK